MIVLPTAWWAHYIFDMAAWLAGLAAARWQYRHWPEDAGLLARTTAPGYYLALASGSLVGAWLLGSANSLRSMALAPSHSVAGALAGGIVAVELWKGRNGIRESTGGAFVLPFCVGLAVGRLGCLFSGMADFTYGVPTHVSWAVDLGDAVGRHPVQLYEALTMAAFALVYARARLGRADWARRRAFHAMILVYAAQRFVWEFLKPYPVLVGPLNVFHLLMLGLGAYGFIWWRRGAGEPSPA